MRNRGDGGDGRVVANVPGQVQGAAGRGESCRHFALWFGHGSGCLYKKRVTDQSEGVVVVLAQQAHPVIVSGAFLRT